MTFVEFKEAFASAPKTIREIRSETGLSQAAFAAEYGIPKRTIENWEAGVTTPPEYVTSLLAYVVYSREK